MTKAETTAAQAEGGMRTIFLPRAEGNNVQQFEFVCINGRPYQVPRGKPVEVPEAVAEVLEHAMLQEAENQEQMQRLREGQELKA